MTLTLDIFFVHFGTITVGIMLIIFMALWIKSHFFSEYETDLESIVASAMASATLPTSLALMICAFDPSKIPLLSDLHVFLALAGAILAFVSVRSIGKAWKEAGNSESDEPSSKDETNLPEE